MMNLTHWRLLVAVADAGNISRAAEQAGITQSGASQAIAQLESSLGIQVFSRDRRHLSVTALGERVIAQARAMLMNFEAIRVLADESRGLDRARIRIGSFPSVLSGVLPDLMRSFRRRHPGIELLALEGTDEEVETWLLAGTVDLGVVLNPTPARQALLLGQDAWVAILPAAHRLAGRASEPGIALAELASEAFILATGGCAVNGQRLAEDAGLVLSDVRVTVRDWASACVLVKEGMGAAVVPASTLPDDLHGIRVMQLDPPVHRRFGLVRSSAREASRATLALWDALQASVPLPADMV